jgi:hypothetical protein
MHIEYYQFLRPRGSDWMYFSSGQQMVVHFNRPYFRDNVCDISCVSCLISSIFRFKWPRHFWSTAKPRFWILSFISKFTLFNFLSGVDIRCPKQKMGFQLRGFLWTVFLLKNMSGCLPIKWLWYIIALGTLESSSVRNQLRIEPWCTYFTRGCTPKYKTNSCWHFIEGAPHITGTALVWI